MDANEIRAGYSNEPCDLDHRDWLLDAMSDRYANGDSLALIAGLVYADIGRQPLPDWLFEALVCHLSEMALVGGDAQLAKQLRADRNRANQERIDATRFGCILHIRNMQGKGKFHPVTRGLNPIFSERWLAQFGELTDIADWGKTRPDAFGNASVLLEGTQYCGEFDTMVAAYKRFVRVRKGAIGSFYCPDPISRILQLTPRIHEGKVPRKK